MEEEYQALREVWSAGDRDRERALRLLYLAWWHWAEPEFLTGLSYDSDVVQLWREIFQHFGGEASKDAEFLYVAAIMVTITPWAFGEEEHWVTTAERMEARAVLLEPGGFAPDKFQGRGAFGDYFAHQSHASMK